MAMNKGEAKLVVSTLADFLEAGISLAESVGRLKAVSPKYAQVWQDAKENIQKGYPFSESLVGVWDESLIAVVRAGEDSGNVQGMFRDIEDALTIEMEVLAKLKSLYYPIAMFFGGLAVGLIFMISVIPGIVDSLPSVDSFILELSITLSDFVHLHFPYLLIGLVGLTLLIVYLFRSRAFRVGMLNMALSIKPLRVAITQLQFGIWTRYLALTLSSGIGTSESLKMTTNILSGKMREVVQGIQADLHNNIRLEDSVDAARLPANDPRQLYLPFFVSTAFTTGGQTGDLSTALAKASPALIRQGTARLETVVGISRAVAIGFAALIILSPLGIVYSEMFKALENM